VLFWHVRLPVSVQPVQSSLLLQAPFPSVPQPAAPHIPPLQLVP
jgi:hypothetical protein